MKNKLIKEFSECDIIEYTLNINGEYPIIWFHFDSTIIRSSDAAYYSESQKLCVHNDSLRNYMTDMTFEEKSELMEYMKKKYNIIIFEVA